MPTFDGFDFMDISSNDKFSLSDSSISSKINVVAVTRDDNKIPSYDEINNFSFLKILWYLLLADAGGWVMFQ